MEKRTANIILVCKGHHNFGKELTLKQAVAHYMSEICGCPLECYNDHVLRGIVWEAAMDFIDTCDAPRSFLYHIKDARYHCDWSPREGVDDITAVLIAFRLCRVRDENASYINGFTEELANIHQLKE